MKFSFSLWIIFASIPFVILGGSIYIMEQAYKNIEENEIFEIQNLIKIQKEALISDFDFFIDTVEVYPNLPEWKSSSYSGKIITEQGGISEFEETSKREAARFLISNVGFQSFGVTLIDGRMYFLEPFEHQSSLSKVNFSDREWFQGVERTQDTYISDVFISAASNHPIIVISTPIFSNNKEIIGMWGGSLDLEYLSSFLKEVKKKGSSILLLDETNVIIANTDNIDFNEIVFEKTMTELISQSNGLNYLKTDEEHIFIDEIQVGNKHWKMVTKIPNENFLSQVNLYGSGNFILIFAMIVFIIIAEILLFSFLRKNFQLNLDINENRRILVKQERLAAIGELASRVAHDIRNPLSNIAMAVKSIEEKPQDTKLSNDAIKEKLQIASKNIERISHQVNDVLDYVKERKIIREKISLSSFVDETIQLFQVPKNIKIESQTSDLKVLADPIQLQIVFNNLLLNAIQAIGKEPGKIRIQYSEDDDSVQINLENSGPSIPQDILPHIFESLITTKQEGTGLGLASCKRIIEKHGGEIKAVNNPTTFTITLPKS